MQFVSRHNLLIPGLIVRKGAPAACTIVDFLTRPAKTCMLSFIQVSEDTDWIESERLWCFGKKGRDLN